MHQERLAVPINERGLPLLDQEALDALFSSVYQPIQRYAPETERYLAVRSEQIRSWFDLLKAHQMYNLEYRNAEYTKLFPHLEEVLGPFETNSQGTSYWLALCLAIKEAYAMRMRTLGNVLGTLRERR